MRLMLSSLLAASLICAPAFAAECARPADHNAMDVTALKTQLMVMALTCRADEKYNAFVNKYKPDLVSTDKNLATFFTRSYGRTGAKQRDDYITNLANSQSQTGLKEGSLYCDRNMTIFDEVMALRSESELTDFAAGKGVAQPISLSDCGPEPARPVRTARTTRSHKAS